MSARVLLNLLNELEKSDKMQGLPSNEINVFNETEAQMLDFIYHMKLKLIKNHIFGLKTSKFSHLLSELYNRRH